MGNETGEKRTQELKNPITVLAEKQEMLNRLIDNGLAVPIYRVISGGERITESRPVGENYVDIRRKEIVGATSLIAVVIQIAEDEFIVSNFGDLQMQVIKVRKENLSPESNLSAHLNAGYVDWITSGTSDTKAITPVRLFDITMGPSPSSVVADSATQPDIVIEKLTNGIKWLREKQQEMLANRTQAANQATSIVSKFLESSDESPPTETP